MADYKQIVPWIKKWEGGLSKATTDSASSYPVPDGSGYHTNKGVTWRTFESLGSKLGYTPTPALFYQMPDDIWGKIFKQGYWDPIGGDKINSQGIAETIADWGWGAGPGTAVKNVKKYLGVAQTTTMDTATINLINSKNEKQLHDGLSAFKKNWYLTLPNQSANYNGWANRLNDLYKVTVGKIGTAGAIGILGVLVAFSIGLLIFSTSTSEKKTVSRESRG